MHEAIILPFGSSTYRVAPSKIIALGLNYAEHITESVSVLTGGFKPDVPPEPVLFPKLPSSLVGPDQPIRIPALLDRYAFSSERTDYEGELAFIIGTGGKNIAEEAAWEHILGFTCANDVSQRDFQNGDRAGWTRGKSLDTFCPIGPRVVPRDELENVQRLHIETRLNGKVVQSGNTAQLIVSIPRMIAFISANFTLCEGDIILTGTPAGVGPIVHGDVVEVEVEGIGVLRNPVEDERRA